MVKTVAIVGRPNVGKSTLFNRLVGRETALVESTPGVTRDWREGAARLGTLRFQVIDTAGLEGPVTGRSSRISKKAHLSADDVALGPRLLERTGEALDEADLVLFVIDGRAGLLPLDRHFAQWLRPRGLPVVLVVNKCESQAAIDAALGPDFAEAHGLGFGPPVALAAAHHAGFEALEAALSPYLSDPAAPAASADEAAAEFDEAGPDDSEAEAPPKVLQLAVVGRPNAGKSTLINHLLRRKRLLTGPEPGLTREAVPIDWVFEGQPVRLVDTAGLRRQARVVEKLEAMSNAAALAAVDRSHVVVLVVDATLGLDRQDLTIARRVAEEGRALVVAANKWDLLSGEAATAARTALGERIASSLPQVKGVALVPLSAQSGRGVSALMPAVMAAYETWTRRIPTGALNRWLAAVIARHPPPMAGGREVRIRYVTQVNTRPPSFAFWTSRPKTLPDSYRRYLENALREAFDLWGVPLRLMWRQGDNPYRR